ncbi:MAG TPA: carboxypeptidase regulatory-like domain-containing protein, partial [Thermoanaerobaculia bacterium]|nr:carboxypeptidase regulatory-like domain-containing protein [Thermoanaerobaculia bacterium]
LTSTSAHVDELYDDLACVPFCDVTTGTPIAVTAGADTPGVDFALVLGGSISGTVTEESTGDPLSGEFVIIFDNSGNFRGSGFTAGGGTYLVGGLPSGSYRARTSTSGHIDELYDDIPCASGCDVTTGTAIPVTAGANTPDVDFALDQGGSLSGTITDVSTTDPLQGVSVLVFDDAGFFVNSSSSQSDGTFTVGGLPSGTYFARTFNSTYLDELYDDLPCHFGCNVTAGMSISVTVGSDTPNVDFALALGGSLAGTVSEVATADPVANVEIRVYDSSGILRRTRFTAANGSYSAGGLPTGSYFAHTVTTTHLDELYDNLQCEPGCNPTTGTAIAVTAGSPSSGIDFVLTRLGSVAGSVTDAGTGAPLAGVRVTVFDSLGRPQGSTQTLGDGSYLAHGIFPGDVHVKAGPTSSHAAQMLDRLPFGLNVLAGATVPVSLSSTTTGVDFSMWSLGACGLPDNLLLSSLTLTSVVEYAACGSLSAGPQFEVGATGQVALRAGGGVTLASGVAVGTGGALVVSSGSLFPPPIGDIVYQETFDDGFALGWDSSNGPTDLWRLDTDCAAPAAGSPTLSFGRSAPDCDYDLTGQTPSGWARSPLIDLSSASTASLELDHSWETEGGGFFDRMSVEVSDDGGASWTEVWTTTDATSGGFVPEVLDVSAFASPAFRFRLVFEAGDSILNGFAGWSIDTVTVRAN